jgi:ubiquitin carboxyl-terminal hydrolase 20/33
LQGGHYVAYCLNEVEQQWYLFDDSYVTAVSEDEVKSKEAYVLFYRRKQPTIEESRRKLASIATLPTAESAQNTVYLCRRWYWRYLCTSNPGPIDHSRFLCPHGKPNVGRGNDAGTAQLLNELLCIPEAVWERLADLHGGGPMIDARWLEECGCRVCEQEDVLRQAEQREVAAIDRRYITSGEVWFIISAEWLSRWRQFTSGGPRPGPVDNTCLLVEATGRPRPNLERTKHYRALVPDVWDYFVQHYGGGPPIIRQELDIYAKPVAAPKRLGKLHTKTSLPDVTSMEE